MRGGIWQVRVACPWGHLRKHGNILLLGLFSKRLWKPSRLVLPWSSRGRLLPGSSSPVAPTDTILLPWHSHLLSIPGCSSEISGWWWRREELTYGCWRSSHRQLEDRQCNRTGNFHYNVRPKMKSPALPLLAMWLRTHEWASMSSCVIEVNHTNKPIDFQDGWRKHTRALCHL